MNNKDYLEIIEGMLFLAGDDGLNVKAIASILEVDKKKATNIIDELIEIYNQKELSGIQIVNFGGNYKLSTNPKHYMYYQKMVDQASANLSNAALETLAIIAYNQPITRTKIEDIRGVGCDSMIRKLAAKALIKEVGREDTPGMPILYGVTDEFMDAFSLTSLDELPALEDIIETDDQDDIFATRYQEDLTKDEEKLN